MAAVDRQISGFQMPGTLVEDFARHAHAVAAAGIYDLRIHDEQVVHPLVIAQWRIDPLVWITNPRPGSGTHILAAVPRTPLFGGIAPWPLSAERRRP